MAWRSFSIGYSESRAKETITIPVEGDDLDRAAGRGPAGRGPEGQCVARQGKFIQGGLDERRDFAEGYAEWYRRHHVRPLCGEQRDGVAAGEKNVFRCGWEDADLALRKYRFFSKRTKHAVRPQAIIGPEKV